MYCSLVYLLTINNIRFLIPYIIENRSQIIYSYLQR